jgi:coenzyme F420-0:L-glutamate ligase / coenzyme F420-1:gamma-L-glutamate ligase
LKITAYTVDDVPMIRQGDDLAAIAADRTKLEDGDIVVYASTIVSKSEGRRYLMDRITPTAKAEELASLNAEDPHFIQYVLDNSTKVLWKHPLLVETILGNVCINAGIDRSNTETDYILLLPSDPDASARRIRDRILELTGKRVAVIITDTNGRSFREGQVGAAGISAVHDKRGDVDLFGHELKITIQGIVDEVAACANMLMGESNEGTPIAVIRGYEYLKDDLGIAVTYRKDREDFVKTALLEKVSRDDKPPATKAKVKKAKAY